MQDKNAGFEPDELAFYAPTPDHRYLAVVFAKPTAAEGPYVVGTLDHPVHPLLAYPGELLAYDGKHDGRTVAVNVHDHATLSPGIYPGVIMSSSIPGNTEFWVQLTAPEDQSPVRVALADITFAE